MIKFKCLNSYSNHFNVLLTLNYFINGNLQFIFGNISGKLSVLFSSLLQKI